MAALFFGQPLMLAQAFVPTLVLRITFAKRKDRVVRRWLPLRSGRSDADQDRPVSASFKLDGQGIHVQPNLGGRNSGGIRYCCTAFGRIPDRFSWEKRQNPIRRAHSPMASSTILTAAKTNPVAMRDALTRDRRQRAILLFGPIAALGRRLHLQEP